MLDLHATERPREKLLARGAAALSDGELIAILLRTGTAGASVLDLAQALVRRVDGHLIRFADLTFAELCSVRGIGPDKAARPHLHPRPFHPPLPTGKARFSSPANKWPTCCWACARSMPKLA